MSYRAKAQSVKKPHRVYSVCPCPIPTAICFRPHLCPLFSGHSAPATLIPCSPYTPHTFLSSASELAVPFAYNTFPPETSTANSLTSSKSLYSVTFAEAASEYPRQISTLPPPSSPVQLGFIFIHNRHYFLTSSGLEVYIFPLSVSR